MMEFLYVEGGRPLSGSVVVEGAKNAALPACVATLLTDDPVILHRVPQLRDVSTILFTLGDLGKRVVRHETDVIVAGNGPLSAEANAYSVRQMRASFLVLGPLVARLGCAVVPLPGGCAIGERPVDLHLNGLKALGAEIEERAGVVTVKAAGLKGARIDFPFPSVGATEQIVMAATLAHGETEIRNGAVEPEVGDLVRLLTQMGAEIEVDGRTYWISGKAELHGANHTLVSDRMEAGTLLLAGVITGGEVAIEDVESDSLQAFLDALSASGVSVSEKAGVLTAASAQAPHAVRVETAPHPEFPTDLHPPLAAYLSVISGTSTIVETVFESRFTYADSLRKMGAQIAIGPGRATITGVRGLRGCEVCAPDIRAGAAVVLAALAAQGRTIVTGLEHIDRGYAHLEEKLRGLGANIERRHPS